LISGEEFLKDMDENGTESGFPKAEYKIAACG